MPLHFLSLKYLTSKEHGSCYFFSCLEALPLHILVIVYSCNIYNKWSPTWYGVFTGKRLSLPKEYPFPVGVGTSAQGWLNPLSVIQCFAVEFKGMARGCSLDICKQQRLNEGLMVFADSEQTL